MVYKRVARANHALTIVDHFAIRITVNCFALKQRHERRKRQSDRKGKREETEKYEETEKQEETEERKK